MAEKARSGTASATKRIRQQSKPWRLESNLGAGSGGWRFVAAYATRKAAQEALDRNVGLGDEPGTYRIIDRREATHA